MSLRWRRNSRNAPKHTIDFELASGSPPNNVFVTKANRSVTIVADLMPSCRTSVRYGSPVMNPVARCANNLHREFSMAAEAAITALRETSAKLSQITPSDRFTEQWWPPAVYQIEFSYGPPEQIVDDFCSELPVTRGKSLAATPRLAPKYESFDLTMEGVAIRWDHQYFGRAPTG
jgi:hypothetical protein